MPSRPRPAPCPCADMVTVVRRIVPIEATAIRKFVTVFLPLARVETGS